MSDSLENRVVKKLHPIVRVAAYFGALFSIFAAIVSLFSILDSSSQWGALAALGRAFGWVILAWFFWYAGKYSLNPLKVPLFSK